MKFRWHRGSLDASMQTAVEFDGTREALRAVLAKNAQRWFPNLDLDNIRVEPYGFDDRIGWDTHIVMVSEEAVGYTDGAVSQPLDVPSEQRQ